MSHIGYKKGRLPNKFVYLKDEEILAYGASLNVEEDVLASIGLNASQIERAKLHKRWRRLWDIGRGCGLELEGEGA